MGRSDLVNRLRNSRASSSWAWSAFCLGHVERQPGRPYRPRIEQGRALSSLHCASCHALSADTVIVGPSLAGIGMRAGQSVPGLDPRQYLELSILAPEDYVVEGFGNLMPGDFGKKLTGEELDALVAYLLTLR